MQKKQSKYLTDAGAMEVLLKGGKIQSVHVHQKPAFPEIHYYLGKDGQLKNQFGDPDGGCLFGYAGWRWIEVK